VIVATTGDHGANVCDDLVGTKKRAIHPTTSLLHQHSQGKWTIGEGLRIGDVLDSVTCMFLDVDLEAHDSIFSKVFICFGTSGCF